MVDFTVFICYYSDMDIRQKIKMQMIKSGIKSDTELASKCGWSKSNYANKLKRANFKLSDLEAIAEALGCKLLIEFIDEKGVENE